jgi:hypothetical protein
MITQTLLKTLKVVPLTALLSAYLSVYIRTQHNVGTSEAQIRIKAAGTSTIDGAVLLAASALPCPAFTLSEVFCPGLAWAAEMADDWHLRAHTLSTSNT